MKSGRMYTIMAGSKQPKWSAIAGVLNPFTGECKQQVLLVKINFNLNYGKQYKGGKKQINNADTDSGILQGVKN